MPEKNSRRDILKKILVASPLAIPLAGLGLIRLTARPIDRIVDGQRVIYYDSSINSSRSMDLYNNNGRLIKRIHDADGSGVIGDSFFDRYEIFKEDGSEELYNKPYHYDREKLNEATQLFQHFKRRIDELRLENRL